MAAFAADPALQTAYGALIRDESILNDDRHRNAPRILFEAFDRRRLEAENFIDLNTLVHRRGLIQKHGGFDVTLGRLYDWDLVLRYTQDSPARCLPVAAARYRKVDRQRISDTVPLGPNFFRVRRQWPKAAAVARPPRVLYVLWHFPQLSETYVETEIRSMRRMGVQIEVWAEHGPASPYPTDLPIHRGTLEDAIRSFQPDVLHVHWLGIVRKNLALLHRSNLPITLRGHGFDTTDDGLRAIMALPGMRRAFCFPNQIPLAELNEPRIRPMPATFDTALFRPERQKDRRMVIRTSACQPSKDLGRFFEIAKALADHHFVLAMVTVRTHEAYRDDVRAMWRKAGSPGELHFDLPRERIAELMGKAGIYLHTILQPGEKPHGRPIGMPISIAEAMATGAHILIRSGTNMDQYVADAGQVYHDTAHAVRMIRETAGWSDEAWEGAWRRSVDRAYVHHADDSVLRPIYDEWCTILAGQVTTPRITQTLPLPEMPAAPPVVAGD